MAYSASKRKATGDSSTSVVESGFVHQREMPTPKPIRYSESLITTKTRQCANKDYFKNYII